MQKNTKTKRRKFLKIIGSTSILGAMPATSSARTSSLKVSENADVPSRTIALDTSAHSGLRTAEVQLYPDDLVVFEAGGTESNVGQNTFRLGVEDLITSRGTRKPERAAATLNSVESSERRTSEECRTGGGERYENGDTASIKPSNGNEPNEKTEDVVAQDDADDSDSDYDYTKDYEGTVYTRLQNDVGERCNFTQANRWTASGGAVDWYHYDWCWEAAGQYSHRNHGIVEQNFNGNKGYSKLWCDFNYDPALGGGSHEAYHRNSITMYPDGHMWWWGRVYTRDANAEYFTDIGFNYKASNPCE